MVHVDPPLQTVPHPPQLLLSVRVLVSHPLALEPSQFASPVLHVQLTATLDTLEEAMVPEPLETEQVCEVGWAATVTR